MKTIKSKAKKEKKSTISFNPCLYSLYIYYVCLRFLLYRKDEKKKEEEGKKNEKKKKEKIQ